MTTNQTALALQRAWAPTGYGQQTGLFAPQLAEQYDLAISSFYGLEGSRIVWNDIPVFPGIGGDFGNDTLLAARPQLLRR